MIQESDVVVSMLTGMNRISETGLFSFDRFPLIEWLKRYALNNHFATDLGKIRM